MGYGVIKGATASYGSYSLEELEKKHKEFISLTWEGCSPTEIEERFTGYYGLLPVVILEIKGKDTGCDTLHRARWVDVTEDLGSCHTYCYPRSADKQLMGRANLPGVPLLYTCGTAMNSLKEARSDKVENASLMHSEWKFQDTDVWRTAFMISPKRLDQGTAPYQDAWEKAIREFILKSDRIPAEYLLALYDRVSQLFLARNYEVSSWIAHRIMQDMRAADMITYPSIMADEHELCHAFSAGPIDKGRLGLDRVEQVVTKDDSNYVVREGRLMAGRINWRKIKPRPLQ